MLGNLLGASEASPCPAYCLSYYPVPRLSFTHFQNIYLPGDIRKCPVFEVKWNRI